MEWINIEHKGQPKNDGWYLAYDGITFDRMLYKNKKWISQHKTYKSGNITQNVATRDDLTEYIIHYSNVKLPITISEPKTDDNTSDTNLNIGCVSNSYMKDCLIQDSCFSFKTKRCNKNCKLYQQLLLTSYTKKRFWFGFAALF